MNKELNAFAIEKSCVNNFEITENTRIEQDLGIYGDDSTEFLIAYGKKFKVDVSKFLAADYFSPEGLDSISFIIRCVTCKPKPIKKILTIGHLEKGIIAGILSDAVINS